MEINYPCGICRKEVFDDAIECEICRFWIHRTCGKLKKRDLAFLSNPSYHYYCPKCKEVFPFHNVENYELQWLVNKFDVNEDIFYFCNKCNDITLDCFRFDNCKRGQWDRNKDPDTHFF